MKLLPNQRTTLTRRQDEEGPRSWTTVLLQCLLSWGTADVILKMLQALGPCLRTVSYKRGSSLKANVISLEKWEKGWEIKLVGRFWRSLLEHFCILSRKKKSFFPDQD